MNFDDAPEDAAYRAKIRDWLDENAIPVPPTKRHRTDTPEWLDIAHRWQRLKAEAGYAGISWPTDWGGQGGTGAQQLIFEQEEAARGLYFFFFSTGLGLCVPTVATFADQETRDRFTGPALRGEEVWCQLFSEPGAGSDLAGLQTRAARDGGDWIVNGQKVWTTGAQYSDFAILLVRTDPHAPKHKGLTMFWLDMRAPGVEVRPIMQMSGEANFNEVFLTDVRIHDSQRLGAVNAGWNTALTTLMNERVSIGAVGGPEMADALALLGDRAHHPAIRSMLVGHFVRQEGLRLTRSRLLTAISRGEKPGPENAIMKLLAAAGMQDFARDVLEARGPMGLIVDRSAEAVEGVFQDNLTWSPGYRIAGGTDEILRTIIAERVLGLPADHRPDKSAPFRARESQQ